jgi:sec-independent protein translocase protein TatA
MEEREMPGFQELFLILIIVVVLFGASRLPQLGRGLGEGISNFKRGLKNGGEDSIEDGKSDADASS